MSRPDRHDGLLMLAVLILLCSAAYFAFTTAEGQHGPLGCSW